MFRSIRHGLFAALAGFTLLICVCYTGLALVIAYVTEDMLVDRLMAREAAAMTAGVRTGSRPGSPDAGLVRAYYSVETLPPAVRAQVGADRQRAEVFTDTGQHYHLRTLDLDPGTGGKPQRVWLVADAGPLLVVSALVRDVGGVVLAVALCLIGLALLLAWLLARRLVAPLQTLAEEVRRLEPGAAFAFSARRRRDEIGYLADKLGTTLAELHAALAREQAFTRDIGHELRTPLTVMNNALSEAAARPLGPQDVALLRSGLGDVTQTVDVLFALARAEHVGSEALDLRLCIEEVLLRRLHEGAWDEDRLVLDLPDRLPVTGNRHLCRLLIDNCIGNALFHGQAGAGMQLVFAADTLSIANAVDPARPAAAQGFQHGQNLLRRMAAAMRWDLRFHAGADIYRVDIVPLRH